MLKLLIKKWWVILVQGILLVLLSLYIFSNPADVLAGVSIWFALLIIISGILGIVGWMAADNDERENITVLWNLASVILGVLMLFHISAIMKVLTVVYGLWVLLTGVRLVESGWSLKKNHSFGWVMLVTGLLSIVAAIAMIVDISPGAKGVSIILGLQVFLTGIVLMIFAFIKKSFAKKVDAKIASIKSYVKRR